jgi:hypothetical protein
MEVLHHAGIQQARNREGLCEKQLKQVGQCRPCIFCTLELYTACMIAVCTPGAPLACDSAASLVVLSVVPRCITQYRSRVYVRCDHAVTLMLQLHLMVSLLLLPRTSTCLLPANLQCAVRLQLCKSASIIMCTRITGRVEAGYPLCTVCQHSSQLQVHVAAVCSLHL